MLHHWHGKRITGCYCLVATCWTRLIFAGVIWIRIFIQVLNSVNQGMNSIEQKVLCSSHAHAPSRRICWTPLSHLWVWVWNKWLQIRACIANPRIVIFHVLPVHFYNFFRDLNNAKFYSTNWCTAQHWSAASVANTWPMPVSYLRIPSKMDQSKFPPIRSHVLIIGVRYCIYCCQMRRLYIMLLSWSCTIIHTIKKSQVSALNIDSTQYHLYLTTHTNKTAFWCHTEVTATNLGCRFKTRSTSAQRISCDLDAWSSGSARRKEMASKS